MNVFVDASVIIAANVSESGGSAFVLRLGRIGELRLITSEPVIEEVMRNASKIHVSSEEVETLTVDSKIHIVKGPRQKLIEKYAKITSEKDAHVLAAAVEAKTKIIITLDKKHLLRKEVKKSVKSIVDVLTPRELLERLTDQEKSN